MGTKRAVPPVDPLSLPVGTQVGAWRVVGWGGRGSNGTLYRVEKVGQEEQGPFALKLASTAGDERFAREAWLLSHAPSPYTPRFYDEGVWEHPSGLFPYVVMEWVEGESLYEWARRRNPTSRQVLGLLANVARALEATHAAGAVHRDVKGANILVRQVDGRAFLIDFGAGHYRGAATLTSKLLPPGTPGYRSPEAWGFLKVFSRHPTVLYAASACDDLFALGVTAYRLVTDKYPPLTQPEEPGAQVWREDGRGPRPPRELNPRVSAELDALIRQLLAIAPDERFGGHAGEAAEALEQAVRSAGPEADSPLFLMANGCVAGCRSSGEVQLAEQEDAAAREEQAQQRTEERGQAAQVSRRLAFAPAWAVGCAVVVLGAVLALLAVRGPHRTQTGLEAGAPVTVGDGVRSASTATQEPARVGAKASPVTQPMPENPLPGQRRPPCQPNGELAIRGGCWLRITDAKPPCLGYLYDLNGVCYAPLYSAGRQPTSDPP
jgi:predicted Ser/Thr protein kinase